MTRRQAPEAAHTAAEAPIHRALDRLERRIRPVGNRATPRTRPTGPLVSERGHLLHPAENDGEKPS